MWRQESSWGALAVTERHRKDLPEHPPQQEVPDETGQKSGLKALAIHLCHYLLAIFFTESK